MRLARFNIAALALTLLATGSVALGARCLSPGMARCSWASLTGRAPHLDVPYLGTRPEVVDRMLTLAGVGRGTRVLDLGTGDGRIMIAAARRGAEGLGVDIDPVLVAEARTAAASVGMNHRARFAAGDLFATPLRGYDVVTMFLLPAVNLRLRPHLLGELAPGARIVSHAFDMADWRPDATARVGGSHLYLWRVPARIEGTWRLVDRTGRPAELRLHQHFQDVGGMLGGWPLTDTRLDGDRLHFAAGDGADARVFDGIVTGDRLRGDGWHAIRTTPATGWQDRTVRHDGAPDMPPSRHHGAG